MYTGIVTADTAFDIAAHFVKFGPTLLLNARLANFANCYISINDRVSDKSIFEKCIVIVI